MQLVKLIDYLIQHQKTVLRICYVILALLVLIDALPFVVDKGKAHSAVEKLPGFWAVFGLVGCIFLIIASKKFGDLGIVKREDYYND